jgi:ABC-type glycerol-3-phosphate transport system substrate-binding protein
MKHSRTLLLALSAVWGLSFAGATTTVQADTLIHACKKNNVKNATLRIIIPPVICKANETEITWPSQVSENGGANANNGIVKATNVKINGGDNHVSPGASFTVTFDYNLGAWLSGLRRATLCRLE